MATALKFRFADCERWCLAWGVRVLCPRWFPTSPSACPDVKEGYGSQITWERDISLGSGAPAALPPEAVLDHLVDIAIRNEPRERERDALERHVDTFSGELELVEPTSLAGRFRQSLRNGGVLHPQSYWHLAWLLLVTACFAYNCVTIPLRSTFPYQTADNWSTWFIFDLACDAVYLLDLVLVKPHVIFVYDGFWVREKSLTRRHYFAKWQFVMDILALVPLDLLYLKYGTELVMLRLPRVLKMQTFWELFDHLDSMLMSPYLVRVARTLCYMMFLVHLNACGYYAFSAREGLGLNNWTYKGGDGNAYIRCFYFATKTATSVGKNPRPETEGEFLFMTCSWLMGVFVFALLIGQIRDIVATASRTRTEHRKRLDETLEHMRALSLPDHVQRRVQSWFTFADQHQPFDEARILNSLPQKLKTDVALDVHGTTLAKVHLFQKIADQALIRDLVLKLRSVIYLPGDFICRKNEVGKEMYIVKTGQVEVLAPTNGEVLATLGEGSVFGEISLLALAGGNRRTADVRSKGFSNLFVLSKSDLHDTLVYYPDAQKILKQKAEALMQENADRERRENRQARGSSSPSSEGEDDEEPRSESPSSGGEALLETVSDESAADEEHQAPGEFPPPPAFRRHPVVRIEVTLEESPPSTSADDQGPLPGEDVGCAASTPTPAITESPPPTREPESRPSPPPASPPQTSPPPASPPPASPPPASPTPESAALPTLQVTQPTPDVDSDLTSVTCTTVDSRSSASRCSRSGSTCSCTCSCSCSCSSSCDLATSRRSRPSGTTGTAGTGAAVACRPARPDEQCEQESDPDDGDTLSDLSSASLLSPLLSPVLEPRAPRAPPAEPQAQVGRLQRRRVSAPAPSSGITTVFDVADGPSPMAARARLSLSGPPGRARHLGRHLGSSHRTHQ
ncbi:Cyclic nucleotide-gated cation channel beta-3 [Frankliniella fusca]|uniref:Cyclic nucleotide-gated cation channel beta-3 n=1 Tax=Frankliniella fusca TaxID=407009 RepID=A0AAE1HQ88_9NEOP|nr:Cyclic nucleotide-gated cation channel beta-3 [Frankliniella fusca]